jgi:hypothetical protein
MRDLQEKSDHEVVNISHSGSSDAAERTHAEQQIKMAATRNQNKMASIVEEQSKNIFSFYLNNFLEGLIFIIIFTWWTAPKCLLNKMKDKPGGEGSN